MRLQKSFSLANKSKLYKACDWNQNIEQTRVLERLDLKSIIGVNKKTMIYKKIPFDLPITNYKFGERQDVTIPDKEFYKLMGEDGIRKMVNDHYELLRVSKIRYLFPEDDEIFEIGKKNSADFMIQICGGPDYFNQNRGKPMLANRHAASEITPEGRIIWLNCYQEVLYDLKIPKNIVLSFWNYLNVFSNWMVNTPK